MNERFALLQKEQIIDISKLLQNHLQSLRDLFGNYFPDLKDFDYKLIRNLYGVGSRLLPHSLQHEFIERLNDSTAKDIFESSYMQKFCSSMVKSYTLVSKKCVESLLLFPSTYCCEQSFSTRHMIKNKFRARLSVEHNLRVCLFNTLPRIDLLVKQSQAHLSY